MQAVQAGDERAFTLLMRRWELPIKALIGRIVMNTAEAEELAQETFVKVWVKRSSYQPAAKFRPWLFTIAVNLARNRLRWWRRRPQVSLEEWTEFSPSQETASKLPSGRSALIEVEQARAVQTAVAQLPLSLREVVVLSVYQDLSHAEVGEALGITAKAVELRLHRARARLRVSLDDLLK